MGSLLIGGCKTPPPPVVATPYVPQLAVVVVENHTDWPWRIEFYREGNPVAPTHSTDASASASGITADPLGWLALAPREVRRVSLTGGIYRVRNELLRAASDSYEPVAPTAESDAGVRLWLVPGRTYAWPLATLFSTEEGSQ